MSDQFADFAVTISKIIRSLRELIYIIQLLLNTFEIKGSAVFTLSRRIDGQSITLLIMKLLCKFLHPFFSKWRVFSLPWTDPLSHQFEIQLVFFFKWMNSSEKWCIVMTILISPLCPLPLFTNNKQLMATYKQRSIKLWFSNECARETPVHNFSTVL